MGRKGLFILLAVVALAAGIGYFMVQPKMVQPKADAGTVENVKAMFKNNPMGIKFDDIKVDESAQDISLFNLTYPVVRLTPLSRRK